MTKSEFFDHVATSSNPLLFSEEDHRKVPKFRQRLGDLTGKRVVEPGCGVGPLTEYLSSWVGPEGHVLAFDSSRGMMEQCGVRTAHLANVERMHDAAETIELQPAAWDLILLFRVFPHFDDKSAVLRHLRPCLAPDGRLVIANLEGSSRLNTLHAGFSDPVRHDHMPCHQGTTALLRECGFEVYSITDSDAEFFADAGLCNGSER